MNLQHLAKRLKRLEKSRDTGEQLYPLLDFDLLTEEERKCYGRYLQADGENRLGDLNETDALMVKDCIRTLGLPEKDAARFWADWKELKDNERS